MTGPRWCQTSNRRFPFAARVNDRWWVLRLNNFPDHQVFTLFIDGAVTSDFSDSPAGGIRADYDEARAAGIRPGTAFSLDASEQAEALAPVQDFAACSSESGQPCNQACCTVGHPEATARPRWCRIRRPRADFPYAARAHGRWWVLRMNNFPDHPMYTLFIDGAVSCDMDDHPPEWGKEWDEGPFLGAMDKAKALRLVQGFEAYGSEIGCPCQRDCCF